MQGNTTLALVKSSFSVYPLLMTMHTMPVEKHVCTQLQIPCSTIVVATPHSKNINLLHAIVNFLRIVTCENYRCMMTYLCFVSKCSCKGKIRF